MNSDFFQDPPRRQTGIFENPLHLTTRELQIFCTDTHLRELEEAEAASRAARQNQGDPTDC